MWPDRVLNPGPLTYESDALPTALSGPADTLNLPVKMPSEVCNLSPSSCRYALLEPEKVNNTDINIWIFQYWKFLVKV